MFVVCSREAKVSEFEVACCIEEDIGALDVAVENSSVVEVM